jgi:hypothetical protein
MRDEHWRPQRFGVASGKHRSPVVGPARFRAEPFPAPAMSPPAPRSALGRFLAGLVVVLGIVAVPLLLVHGGQPTVPEAVDPTPLAAFTTMDGATPQPSVFDISALLVGEWQGELCPSGEEAVPVAVEFSLGEEGLLFSMVTSSDLGVAETLAQGHCTVSGEMVTFGDVAAAGASSRLGGDLIAEFDYGVLRGDLPVTGGGSWWLEPVG